MDVTKLHLLLCLGGDLFGENIISLLGPLLSILWEVFGFPDLFVSSFKGRGDM